MAGYSSELAELERIVKHGGGIAQQARHQLQSELKPDGSIVTNGDRAVETWLRPKLTDLVPGSTVWGEELGWSEPGPSGLWVVDPIDGTSNYNYGSPLWGVSAALISDGEARLGAIFLPDLNESYVAEKGGGAFFNGKAIPPIAPGKIRPEHLISTYEAVLLQYERNQLPGKLRSIGSFVLEGAFVATQRLRGLIGRREKLYDVGAAVLINRELGADIRYADGAPFLESELMLEGPISRTWIIFPKDSGFIAHQKSI